MSTYIKDFDWEEYQDADEEKYEMFYNELEERDNESSRKKQYKMRSYEGYNEEE